MRSRESEREVDPDDGFDASNVEKDVCELTLRLGSIDDGMGTLGRPKIRLLRAGETRRFL